MKVIDRQIIHHIDDVLKGQNVQKSTKYYHQVKDFYKDIDNSLKDDTKMYDVYSYTLEDESQVGHLYWGLTVLYPLCVHGECNMTRGHFHCNETCDEIYYGANGEGLLIFMNEKGETWAEKIYPGSLHYIKGALAHRLINTGDEVLKVVACWSTAAGHDYQRVDEHPFGYRIYKNGHQLRFEKQ